MMIVVAKFRVIVGALAFLLMVSAGQSASAQQPTGKAGPVDQLGSLHCARSEGLHDRAACGPRLASFP